MRRRPPLQHPPAPAPPEHDAGARPGRARRRRGAAAQSRRRAAGAWPPALPDGAPARRARIQPGLLGRGARSGRRTGSGRPSPTGSAFYLTSRGTPNETYYAAQKAVRAIGTQLGRQRRPHLPLAQHRRAQRDARGRRHDLLLRRLDRDRSARLHRRQPGQQPAGHDEVHVLRQEGRHARSCWSTPTASRGWSATGSPRWRRAPCSGPSWPTRPS